MPGLHAQRRIVVVAAIPAQGPPSTGRVPTCTGRASRTTGLLTPFGARSPLIRAVVPPVTSIAVPAKVAAVSGEAAGFSRSRVLCPAPPGNMPQVVERPRWRRRRRIGPWPGSGTRSPAGGAGAASAAARTAAAGRRAMRGSLWGPVCRPGRAAALPGRRERLSSGAEPARRALRGGATTV
jgi:hypothetical protein